MPIKRTSCLFTILLLLFTQINASYHWHPLDIDSEDHSDHEHLPEPEEPEHCDSCKALNQQPTTPLPEQLPLLSEASHYKKLIDTDYFVSSIPFKIYPARAPPQTF